MESYPVMRAMPAMMTMPMMPMMFGQAVAPTTRAVSFDDDRTRSRGNERTCEASQDRIDELDARVEALNLRIKTIQRSVEIQTQILQELKAQGTIAGQKPGIPTPVAEKP